MIGATATLAVTTFAGATPRYEPANLLGTGYSETALGTDSWEIKGASAEPDGGHAIALYRAAQLVAAAHATEFRVLDQHILVTRRVSGGTFIREVATIRIKTVHSDADRAACATRHTERCLTISAGLMAARFGPLLGQPTVLPGVPAEQMAMVVPGAPRIAVSAYAPPASRVAPAAVAENLSPYEAGRRAAQMAIAAHGMGNP